ncbi:hypothetical protein PMIN07_003083 [Paraphaeosphaeria minitans]
MGHKHTKPGNCPTIFECKPNAKRAEAIKQVFARAFEQDPVAVHCLACLVFLMVVLGVGVTTWRAVVVKRQAVREKRVQAARVEAEKGSFSDAI